MKGRRSAGPQEPWRDERRARYRRGHFAEYAAALVLMLKGYRILGRRVATHAGEIDLIARRGRRIAFVEVKRRMSMADAEASVTDRQRQRVRRAALLWIAKRPHYHHHEQGFDLMLCVPGAWPRHIENGL